MKKWLKRIGLACLLEIAVIMMVGIEICLGEYVFHLTIDGLSYAEGYLMNLNANPILTAISIGILASGSYFVSCEIVK